MLRRIIVASVVTLFEMPLAAQPVAPPVVVGATGSAVDPGAELICRRVKETGSLVKSKKACHTKSQWSYIDDQHQRFGRQMVQDGTSRPAGN